MSRRTHWCDHRKHAKNFGDDTTVLIVMLALWSACHYSHQGRKSIEPFDKLLQRAITAEYLNMQESDRIVISTLRRFYLILIKFIDKLLTSKHFLHHLWIIKAPMLVTPTQPPNANAVSLYNVQSQALIKDPITEPSYRTCDYDRYSMKFPTKDVSSVITPIGRSYISLILSQ